jgi:hypothetical protein
MRRTSGWEWSQDKNLANSLNQLLIFTRKGSAFYQFPSRGAANRVQIMKQ